MKHVLSWTNAGGRNFTVVTQIRDLLLLLLLLLLSLKDTQGRALAERTIALQQYGIQDPSHFQLALITISTAGGQSYYYTGE